jgi:hypothetical protein
VIGCGGSGSSSGTTGTGSTAEAEAEKREPAAATGEVGPVWQRPLGRANVVGYELLKASETMFLAKSLATAFELPTALKVKGVNGFGGGPFNNPEDNSITLPYQFATAIIGVISETNLEASETEWGEAVGAVNSFILAHEFGHALIHNFNLPVLGGEEDAADGIATVLLLKPKTARPTPPRRQNSGTPSPASSAGSAAPTKPSSRPWPTTKSSPKNVWRAARPNGNSSARAPNRSSGRP